jgi:hypothetical protein
LAGFRDHGRNDLGRTIGGRGRFAHTPLNHPITGL